MAKINKLKIKVWLVLLLFSLNLKILQAVLFLCVLSIWMPGSPFDPIGYFSNKKNGLSYAHELISTIGMNPVISETDVRKPQTSILFFFFGIALSSYGAL